MTNLKRALSLVLVLALALSMVVMGTSAAKFTDVKADYTYSTEVQFLSDLGILTGYSDGTYKPDGTVTRAEASAVIYRMLSGKTSAANYAGDTKFGDVKAAHWASGYVNFCVELGVVAGYPDGNFYPDKTLTYAEYVTMLVRALGLDIGKDPAYPFGYIALASVESVNADVDLQAADACPRGAVAKLTYNAILDATYARIANNIYVTEKPTIAKDVLKLLSVNGVLTSTGYYSFVDLAAAGEDNFTLSELDTDADVYEAVLTGEFKVAVSDLGKKATVWYKLDSTATNGKKIYAVITDASKDFANIHISLRGYYTATPYELTYVVNDIDKTLKLDKNCQFVENNEFLYASTDTNDKTDEFYPAYSRAWLPIAYKFIDNDQDGDYDFAIRTAYGFAQVTNLTSSKITVDGASSIDRKDDAGNEYAWSAKLGDLAVDDYVLYTCDGAINTGTLPLYAAGAAYVAPNFTKDLYDDTNNATFIKIAKQTGSIASIVDGEKVVIGDKLYRTMKAGDVSDLAAADGTIIGEIGDEYEYYPLASFAMIAKADSVSTTTGKYLVIKAMDKVSTIGDDFIIEAIDENGDSNVYTVKGNDSDNLNKLDGSEIALTYDNLQLLADADDDGTVEAGDHKFYEYKTNAAGYITELTDVSATAGTKINNSDAAFSETSGLLETAAGSYIITDSTLVYVLSGGDYKVYVGGYPTINTNDTTEFTYIRGLDTTTTSGTAKIKAIYIETDDATISGAGSANEDLAGYLKSVTIVNKDGKWFYQYAIWYGGELKTYTSSSVADDSDLSDVVTDDDVIANASNLGGVVVFDVATDGTTISNMTLQKLEANYATTAKDTANDYYYGTCIVTNIDTGNKLITVKPLLNSTATQAVTAGAVIKTATNNGNTASVQKDLITLGTAKTYAYTSSTNVYEFDVTSTNQAYAEVSSVGAIVESDSTVAVGSEFYLISFAYDDDEDAKVITDIFYNKKMVTVTDTTAPTLSAFTATGGAGQVTLNFTTTETGTLYYIIQATASADPADAAAVVAAGSTVAVSATGANAKDIAVAAGTYEVFIAQKDASGNTSNMVSVASFTVT